MTPVDGSPGYQASFSTAEMRIHEETTEARIERPAKTLEAMLALVIFVREFLKLNLIELFLIVIFQYQTIDIIVFSIYKI